MSNHNINNSKATFVPRDAGFFSVFNFLIGSIHNNVKSYPLFDKSVFEKCHGPKTQHFCYWGYEKNSWFDYFEPVQYENNDTTHTSDSIYTLPIINGSNIASKEFTHPQNVKNLVLNTVKFSNWRKDVNKTYSKYIKFKQNIIDDCITFFNSHNIKDPIIGVHYRHPSHSVESGCIYLQQYFDEIDKLICIHPHSKIFIASDTEFGILAFQQKYKDKIIYMTDIERLNLDNILAWAYALTKSQKINEVGFIDNKGYELQHIQSANREVSNNYKMTKDLLSEVLCLSKCDYLIHTISNVALAVSYMNPSSKFITLV